MNFIEQLDEHTFKLHINVKVNSKRQEVIGGGEYLIVHVKAKPSKNKANNELINLLKNKLKIESNQIVILSGVKNKNKIVKIIFMEQGKKELLLNKLLDH